MAERCINTRKPRKPADESVVAAPCSTLRLVMIGRPVRRSTNVKEPLAGGALVVAGEAMHLSSFAEFEDFEVVASSY